MDEGSSGRKNKTGSTEEIEWCDAIRVWLIQDGSGYGRGLIAPLDTRRVAHTRQEWLRKGAYSSAGHSEGGSYKTGVVTEGGL
jgi:hypothetical protein